MNHNKPRFVIYIKSQKGTEDFSQTFSREKLNYICHRITGLYDYDLDFIDEGYNKGRLAKLYFKGSVHYIMTSPALSADGRNYWFQSISSALTQYYNEDGIRGQVYYFLNKVTGSITTNYFMFMYRLMRTAGIIFLNDFNTIGEIVYPFNTTQDLVLNKEKLRSINKSNTSSYVTINDSGQVEIFAKTYGANKKEALLICFAIANLNCNGVKIYQVSEGGMNVLPKPDTAVIQKLMNAEVIIGSYAFESNEFNKNNSLRSPTFIYNLLDKIGVKKCQICDCSIPEIIQAAHIWPVSEIKKSQLSDVDKIDHATNKDNGIWLCENHHKLFDRNIIILSNSGDFLLKDKVPDSYREYVIEITKSTKIINKIKNDGFLKYLELRNKSIDISPYTFLR